MSWVKNKNSKNLSAFRRIQRKLLVYKSMHLSKKYGGNIQSCNQKENLLKSYFI